MSARPPPPSLLRDPALYWYLVSFVDRVNAALRSVPYYAVRGGVFTSWHRDRATNRRAGGDIWSQHLIGLGIDADVPRPDVWAAHLRAAGLIAVVEASHVHAQFFPYRQTPWERFQYLVV